MNKVRFEVLTGVTIKNVVFWDVTLCISCVNRRFGETYPFHVHDSSETSVNVRYTQRHIPEDDILRLWTMITFALPELAIFAYESHKKARNASAKQIIYVIKCIQSGCNSVVCSVSNLCYFQLS
jgi:hypothetical protein